MRRELPPCSLPTLLTGFGVLEARQKLRQLGQVVGLGRPAPIPLTELEAPDSALVAEARTLAEEAYDPDLLGHAERTAAIGRAVGIHLRRAPDPEALAVACLLHDVGLTERFEGPAPFELRGADAAHAICTPHDPKKADVVHEAIALHTSLQAVLGPAEVQLVQSGSGGDLVGLDGELVHPEPARAIARRWPKARGFAERLLGRFAPAAKAHPGSPAHGLLRVGFAGRVRAHHPDG